MSSLASYTWGWWTLQWKRAQKASDGLMKLREECREWPQLLHISEFISTWSRVAFVLITSWISWVDQLIHRVLPELIKKVWMSPWVTKISMGIGFTWLSREYENWMINKMNFKESNMPELASTCTFLPCNWGCQASWKNPLGDWKW